mmetsp:Transcript_6302/g.7229  ORF Transcript_6302/g.7229 Transcript_6302/m.7229 type:complete len:87 (-) Transcript_6302:136-396(-)
MSKKQLQRLLQLGVMILGYCFMTWQISLVEETGQTEFKRRVFLFHDCLNGLAYGHVVSVGFPEGIVRKNVIVQRSEKPIYTKRLAS